MTEEELADLEQEAYARGYLDEAFGLLDEWIAAGLDAWHPELRRDTVLSELTEHCVLLGQARGRTDTYMQVHRLLAKDLPLCTFIGMWLEGVWLQGEGK